MNVREELLAGRQSASCPFSNEGTEILSGKVLHIFELHIHVWDVHAPWL